MSSAAPAPIARSTSALPAVGAAASVAIVAIVALAGWLRFWNIGAGIPHNLGQDEPQIMIRVTQMMRTGDFNPHFFQWPSLVFYLNLAVACFTFLAGAMRGLWNHMDTMPVDALYLSGRQFTALVGTATVGVTFAIGRRWGLGVALAAAALMAVIPNHVRESHFMLTDVPTAFFTSLTLLLSLRAHEQPTTRRLLWAAASAGLAASCRYNGAIALLMPLVVTWTSGVWTSGQVGGGGLNVRVPRTIAVLGAALAGFLVGTPYAIADLSTFLAHYAGLAATFARERPGEAGWSLYLKHLQGAMSWPAALLTAAGLAVALRRIVTGPMRVPFLLLMVFSVAYFVVMARSYQVYGRYLLPLFPPLCVMAAVAAFSAATMLRRALQKPWPRAGTVASAAVLLLMLAPPAASSWNVSRDMGRPSTVDAAYGWILANVPEGSKVVVEAGALQLPNRYVLWPVKSLLERPYADYVREGVTYIVAASPEFQAMLRDPLANRDATVGYHTVLNPTTMVAAFEPSTTVAGPSLRIHKMPR